MVSFALHIVAIIIFGTVKFVTALREKPDVFEATKSFTAAEKKRFVRCPERSLNCYSNQS